MANLVEISTRLNIHGKENKMKCKTAIVNVRMFLTMTSLYVPVLQYNEQKVCKLIEIKASNETKQSKFLSRNMINGKIN